MLVRAGACPSMRSPETPFNNRAFCRRSRGERHPVPIIPQSPVVPPDLYPNPPASSPQTYEAPQLMKSTLTMQTTPKANNIVGHFFALLRCSHVAIP